MKNIEILSPSEQTLPVVLTSPHSGRDYSREFLAQSCLEANALRGSEDSFVDEIFSWAPEEGIPLLKANFPRAYVDLNRGPYEFDPLLFQEPLPDYAKSNSRAVKAGLGTIPRVVGRNSPIYPQKLSLIEAENRLKELYFPYHHSLRELLQKTKEKFGICLLIDCHSMPSIISNADVILGNCHEVSCLQHVSREAGAILENLGYKTVYNIPYAGGYITSHYGRPQDGVNALQIELNRVLYMDEFLRKPGEGFDRLVKNMRTWVKKLGNCLQETKI